jgi:hypothetical protein
MPSELAAAWMTANWLVPVPNAGSRRTAARITPGAICLSISGHFPLRLNSNCEKPVTLPPGRAKLSTNPVATGSPETGNTIGTVRVTCSNAPTAALP